MCELTYDRAPALFVLANVYQNMGVCRDGCECNRPGGDLVFVKHTLVLENRNNLPLPLGNEARSFFKCFIYITEGDNAHICNKAELPDCVGGHKGYGFLLPKAAVSRPMYWMGPDTREVNIVRMVRDVFNPGFSFTVEVRCEHFGGGVRAFSEEQAVFRASLYAPVNDDGRES